MDQAFLGSLEETLKQITSPGTVKAASAKLQSDFYPNPQTLPGLIHLLQNHPDKHIRQLAGVESRKLVARYWEDDQALSQDIKKQIKESLLRSTVAEPEALPRHTSSRVISAIAQLDVDENNWPELMPFLHNGTKSSNASEREVCVYIIYTLLDAGINTLINSTVDVLHLFSQTINDPESQQVRISTVLGLGSISDQIESVTVDQPAEKNPVELFRALIPSMVEVLKQVISSDDDKGISQVFEVFNSLLLCDPALTSKHIGDLVNFMLNNLAAEVSLSEECRIPALQFLLTSVRFKKNKLQSLKLGPMLTVTAMKIIAEGYDEQDDEDDEDTPPLLALRLIDYLSNSLPPSQVLAPLMEALPSYAKSNNPNERRAAFLSINASVEGAPDFVANQINVILPMVVEGLNDSDINVKSGALQALAELASELHEVISDEHEVLLPLVFKVMDTATTLKIGKNACMALDSILEGLDRKVIAEKYLSDLAPKLLQLLSSTQDLQLKSSIVAAISSAAFASGKAYQPYFEPTIHAVEPFVRVTEEMSNDEVALCGITLDALSALAGAVGKEAFSPYVQPLVDASYRCLQSGQSRLRECGFIFLGTLAKHYGSDFSPFLSNVVPEVFKSLKQDEFTGLDDEDDDEDLGIGQDDEDDLLSKLKINSAMATEKEVATDTLGEIIVATKNDFLPYLEEATKNLVELVDHFYEGISRAAVIALWRSFISYYKIGNYPAWTQGFPVQSPLQDPAAALLEVSRKACLELLSGSDERSVTTSICDNFAEALKVAGPVVVGGESELEQLCGELMMILNKTHPSQTMDDDEYEYDGKQEEDNGESSEYDELLTDSATDVVVQLAAALGEKFSPVFNTFFPTLTKYCTSKSSTERASGVGAIAEVVNGLRPACTEWTQSLLDVFMKSLDDKDLEVRSNAAYGVGLLCYYSENVDLIKNNFMSVLQKLQRLLKKVEKKKRKSYGNNGDNEEDSNERGLANACGCVARMTLQYPDLIPMGEVLPVLISRLPLQDGYEENTPVFELLLQLFQQRNETVFGHREDIVNIFDQVFAQQIEADQEELSRTAFANPTVKPFESDELKNKVIELLKYLESEQPGLVTSKPTLQVVLA
ncbi:hypothetical protein TRICI_006272 [Trichomonascus ciferrii]|uniref:Importin N-terminal domain-containing protein n=1 Tax=Trichomonascus ciferrii TaxID=44093 RepID=A0A642UIY1_9ASCO|nr:hypothetical protein TRICI_006272 [Trichomonascus ciferrii]